ncbi:MAG: tetratricopeptide repeat protein, partial [Thermodesulfobacteriota bacterium]|nr:tetratricopeptide repeat protein [Thermodesulfobacteriota bacterium]
NIKIEIEKTAKALAGQSFEVYVINTTHPRINVPAVYTIVPGAHFRERAKGASVPFFAAKMLAAQDDLEAAAAGLDRLNSLYPNSYFLNFYQGQILLNQGRAAEAAGLLRSALEMDPLVEDQAGILTYLGLAYQQMEDFSRAIEVLKRSAGLDDERRDTFNLLGFCYFKTKEHEKAIACFEKVLEIDPGSGIDYANIGSNYRELGNRHEAAEYYRRALELDSSLDWVRENLEKLG